MSHWEIIILKLEGIFHNKDENVFVWINEEDHSRLISMEKGDDVKGIVSRFARLTEALQGKNASSRGFDPTTYGIKKLRRRDSIPLPFDY